MDPNQTQQPNPQVTPVQPISTPPIVPPPVEATVPPKNPSANSGHRKMPVLLGIILLVILIALLGGGTYLMNMKKSQPNQNAPQTTPTKIPPKAWKTYTNAVFGFSFTYPPEWERNGTQITIPIPSECQPPHQCGGGASTINITVSKNTESLPLKDYIYKNEFEEIRDIDGEQIASETATMNSKNYIANNFNTNKTIESLINTKLPGAAATTRVFYAIGFDILAIEFQAIDTKVVEKILASLKFTDQKQELSALNGYPVYVNARYTGNEIGKPNSQQNCAVEKTSASCLYGYTSYTLQTIDSWKTVNDWYATDKAGLGWKFSGGAGAEGSSTATYVKNDERITVLISENPDTKLTVIIIQIPNKSAK